MASFVSPARKALQKKANICVLSAVVLDVIANVLNRSSASGVGIGTIFAVIALPLWVIGLMAYAESKGYSKWMGLLGLLCCIGLIVLVLLPNKWVDEPTGGYGPGDYPRPNG